MIVKDAGKLELSYVPDKILCRDEEIKKLRVFLKSGRVLISGGVGTGKTLLARYIGGDAYINCYMNKTEHRVLEEMLRQLKPRFNPAGLPTQKLWNEVEEGKTVIIDEIDGMNAEELRHFAYSLSRQYELGRRICYIAITRNHFILEQIINDDAIWSTFADRAIVGLKPYTFEEVKEILGYRAGESLNPASYNDEILSLIADIALHSPGHMRTAIDLLRNAAMMAESEGRNEITPDDVREVNREEWISDVESMDRDMLLVMLSVATACKGKAYVSRKEILEMLRVREEEYGIKIGEKRFDELLQILIQQDFIYEGKRGYTILNYPLHLLTGELERRLKEEES